MKFYLLSIITICGLLIGPARTLQIFDSTLTEITCSAAAGVPVFRVMEQGVLYAYDQLPGLFDIEAKFSSTGNNVTLYINGTNRSDNITVKCGHTDPYSSLFQVIFALTLEFVSILPAPIDVHYIEDPPGDLQISWEPPTLVTDEPGSQNVSVDFRITHYIIYISNESTIAVYNASGMSFAIGTDEISCSFWFQVAAINPAGVGERSPPQIFDSHTGCMDSSSSTTVTIIDHVPIAASSGLSAGEITAVIIGIVLIIMGLLIIVAIAITLKLKNDRHQCVKQSLKAELSYYYRSDQLSDTKDSVAEIEKCVESDHCGSENDQDTVDDNNQPSDSTPTRTYSHDGRSYLYAEIDVIAKRKNKVPEPSSTEDTDHHVYTVLEQPSNQVANDTFINANIDIDQDDDHPDSQD